MSAREAAEQKQREYEERMERLKEEVERAQRELSEAHGTIRRLEQQLQELQVSLVVTEIGPQLWLSELLLTKRVMKMC